MPHSCQILQTEPSRDSADGTVIRQHQTPQVTETVDDIVARQKIVRRTSAIIGSTENSDKGAVVPEFVTVLDNHMGTANEVHVIPSQELVDDGLAEAKADPSLVVFPVDGGITGVRP